MADAKFYEAYSRYIDTLERYETWDESVERVMDMHIGYITNNLKIPESSLEILRPLLSDVQEDYVNKLILGAQRALQFGGEQLLTHQARLYNCAASYCDRPEFFGESFYLMLCGTGVGFSVQKHHIAKLPSIAKRTKAPKEFVVPDSIEGWATALDVLLSSFFVGGGKHPEYEGRKILFNFDKIRPKGSFISGGFKAPGSEALRSALVYIEELIKLEITNGATRLHPIVAYDIIMFTADAVISGGVRRSACVCIFSKDDTDMLKAKTGDWFVTQAQRGRSNNSALLLRSEVTLEELQEIMKSVKEVGEPGFILADSLEALFNPLAI